MAPGCGRPAAAADADHTRDHAVGGESVPGNGGPLCAKHHAMKHRGGWRLQQPEPGRFRWTSPLGQTYLTRGEPIWPRLPEPQARASGHEPDDPHDGQHVDMPTFRPGPRRAPRRAPARPRRSAARTSGQPARESPTGTAPSDHGPRRGPHPAAQPVALRAHGRRSAGMSSWWSLLLVDDRGGYYARCPRVARASPGSNAWPGRLFFRSKVAVRATPSAFLAAFRRTVGTSPGAIPQRPRVMVVPRP